MTAGICSFKQKINMDIHTHFINMTTQVINSTTTTDEQPYTHRHHHVFYY